MRRRTTLLPWILLTVPFVTGCADDDGAAPAVEGPAHERAEAPAAPEIPAGAPRVVFLGDSIAAGLHLPAHEAFPAVLQRRLAAEGLAFELVNAGSSGDTTAGGLRRLDWLLRQEPDVVVVELGGNDGLRGVAVDSVEANLRAILERVRAAGAEPVLLGVRLPPNYGADYVQAFEGLYPSLAEEYGAAYVPFFMEGVGGVPDMNLRDGLHPSPAGHERLADNVAPALREVLGELTATGG